MTSISDTLHQPMFRSINLMSIMLIKVLVITANQFKE